MCYLYKWILKFYYIIETNLNTLKYFDLRELDGFCYYPIEVDYKCVLSWWWTKSHKFPIVAKLVKHMLNILTSQIKIEKIFFIIWILTWLYRCHFQIENFDKLIFVNNNCPLDLCIGCCKHFHLASALRSKLWFNKRAWTRIWWWNGTWGVPKSFLWSHSFTSLPKKGKTCLWIFIRQFY